MPTMLDSQGNVLIWDSMQGKWMSLKKGGTVRPTNLSMPMWARDRFVCNCSKPVQAANFCRHLVEYIANCEDADGALLVVARSTLGRKVSMNLPLTGSILINAEATVVPHYSIADEYGLQLVSVFVPEIEVFLNRGDGLVRFVRMARDVVSSWATTRDSLTNLTRRKIPGCGDPKHSKRHDVALARDIRRLAEYRLGPEVGSVAIEDWDADTLMPVLEEVSLTEGYTLKMESKCFACFNEHVTPGSVPEDLIPKV